MTIKNIRSNVGPSLQYRPNLILLHAGTNDMDESLDIATEGNDVKAAAERLGSLIDDITEICPDAVLLVVVILSSCLPGQKARTKEFQALIPGLVAARLDAGKKVLAVDFSSMKLLNRLASADEWQVL